MTYVLLILVAVALVSIGAAVIMGQMLKAEKLKLKELEKRLVGADIGLKSANVLSLDSISRLEALVAQLKADNERLEKELAEASTPAAVGERFDKLFP